MNEIIGSGLLSTNGGRAAHARRRTIRLDVASLMRERGREKEPAMGEMHHKMSPCFLGWC